MKFDLKKPCKACPFLKDTTMTLRPGRMTGIAATLRNDKTVFPCHKTTEHGDDGNTIPRDHEQACMGALTYALKHHHQIPILARLAIRAGETTIHTIASNFDTIEEPGKWKTDR